MLFSTSVAAVAGGVAAVVVDDVVVAAGGVAVAVEVTVELPNTSSSPSSSINNFN